MTMPCGATPWPETSAAPGSWSWPLAELMLGEPRRMAARDRRDRREVAELTSREAEILGLVATGMSYRQIAEMLFLPHRAVQNHVQRTLGKLRLNNRVGLVRFAMAQGRNEPS